MLNPEGTCDQTAPRTPWSKGKLIGAEPPLLLKHVWCIRSKLRADARIRDLAKFNLAIDSKLRGCDVVSIKVEDIAPHRSRRRSRQCPTTKKSGRTVRFELTEHTRETVDEYLRTYGRKPGDYRSRADGTRTAASQHGNTHGLSRAGSQVSVWTQVSTARSRFAGPRPRLSTVVQEISVPSSCC